MAHYSEHYQFMYKTMKIREKKLRDENKKESQKRRGRSYEQNM